MLVKLAVWYLEKKKISLIMNYRINGGLLKPKQNQSYMYGNTFIETEHRYMDNSEMGVPKGNFIFSKPIQRSGENGS